jgi:hypothetical protein
VSGIQAWADDMTRQVVRLPVGLERTLRLILIAVLARGLFRCWLAWGRCHDLPRRESETAADHLRRALGTEPDGGAAAFLAAYEVVRYGTADALSPAQLAEAEAGFADLLRRVRDRLHPDERAVGRGRGA